jgi:protein-disulfide isomerase
VLLKWLMRVESCTEGQYPGWALGRSRLLSTRFVRWGLVASLLGLVGCAPLGNPDAQAPEGAQQGAPGQPPDAVVVELGNSPRQGPNGAAVTIVEFVDFECPFCGEVHGTIQSLLERYPGRLRWVMKNNPLAFHRLAEPLALLALAAKEQQGDPGYWAAADAIFAVPRPSQQTLVDLAVRLQLDPARYARVRALGSAHPQLVADREQAMDLEAEGTPAFFINGRPLAGALPLGEFDAVVQEEFARVAALSPPPGSEPYALLQAKAAPAPGLTRVSIEPPAADSPTWGPENAPVVVQMFSDFECAYCRHVMFTLRELATQHPEQVRVVWRNLPLPFHKHARLAAKAALELRKQKGDVAFWQMAERLYGLEGEALEPLSPALIRRYAQEAGLSAEVVANLAQNQDHDASFDRDLRLADRVGATATPTFIINGYRLVGAQPLHRFERLFQLALAEKQ